MPNIMMAINIQAPEIREQYGLSKYIWQKKRDNEEWDVKGSLVQRAKP